MNVFVNRKMELQNIEDTLEAFMKQSEGVRTPIFEFHGVGGIGKTTILRKVQSFCDEKQVPYIWGDGNQQVQDFSAGIVSQVSKHQYLATSLVEQDALTQSIQAVKVLLERRSVVLLLDSLDAARPDLLSWIEDFLHTLVADNRLFVVLASKRRMSFEDIRPIARKLKLYQLKSFDESSCQEYLDHLAWHTDPDTRALIFDWTHGYPLAVNVMQEALQKGDFKLQEKEDRIKLFSIIMQQVIQRGVFSDVAHPKQDPEWCQAMLSLFSLPRRTVIPLMQRLIEKYEPRYKLASLGAYMTIQRKLNQATEVFDFNVEKGGYTVEPSIRHILKMKLQLEQPEFYYQIHDYLARWNKQRSEQVSGSDRIRHIIEFLYHSANAADSSGLKQLVVQNVQQIISISQQESPDIFENFYQSFLHDSELRTALGATADVALSLLYQENAQLHRAIAVEEAGAACVFALHEFFYYRICDPLLRNRQDLPASVRQQARMVVEEFPVAITMQLYEELLRDVRLREVLGVALEESIKDLQQHNV